MSKPFQVTKILIGGEKDHLDEPDIDKIASPFQKPYQSHSFRLMIVGPSGSGKSNLFLNLLLKVYRGVFTNVYLFCPTYWNDQTLNQLSNIDSQTGEKTLNDDDIFTFDNVKEITEVVHEKLHEIDNSFKNTPKGEAREKTLMVFDDLTNELKTSQIMKDLFTKGRKHEVSVIVMTNKYKVYDPQVRNNCTQLVVFKPTTTLEKMAIAEDISGDGKHMVRIMDAVFDDDVRNFMYVDKEADEKKRYFVNFDKPLKV